ncbi:cation diffusion facilitator family transporter [Tindallia magadiensis]|uniref:Cation diffusion facilitator family transporter n=1 Tax=Tindallia magadiensis TaxID=69895 RepID=A0A1I3DMS4_9FIRM|nr:cation diffusion facilitator family transporter [Tindallia magadiensis]SFH88034.1 cation diffusion facilitator family transporter [Tindallia magadiensis]
MEADEADEADHAQFIKKMIKMSMAGTILFAVTGIFWGYLTNSRMILLDGLYSFLAVGLSGMSLWVVNFIERETESETKRFPFGKNMAEPAIIFLKSFVMIGLVLTTVTFAIQDLLNGGREVKINYTLVYVGFSAMFCLMVFLFLRRKGKNIQSDILKMEALEWKTDGLISLGSTLGFMLAGVLGKTPLAGIVPYMDPIMVLVISLFLIKAPIQSMLGGFRELMRMAPEDKMQQKMNKIVSEIRSKYRFRESFCRVSKVGTALFIEIDFITDDGTRITTIKDTDAVREEIYKALQPIPYDPWLTVSFTEDKKWAI